MPILPDCPIPPTTKCDRDIENNVWVEGRDPDNNVPGICMLDTLEDYQVIYILERDEVARADLKRVTSDAHLLELADTVPRLPTDFEEDKNMKDFGAAQSPFYSIFRGQPPFSQ